MIDTHEYRAREFAVRAHGVQTRKYTNEPYWHHCRDVADLLRTVPHTSEMIAAAWAHDTVEDTSTTFADVALAVGAKAASLVWWLTDTPHVAGNREARKRADRARLAVAPAEAKTIKLCDLIDNSRSIVERDPEFAKVYLTEKRLLLDEALIGGDLQLWARADEIVRRGVQP